MHRNGSIPTCLLALLIAVVLAPGCGGGGGGAPGDTDTPAPTPSASILFPPSDALTNQASITVRGTTQESGAVQAVYVNGLLAQTTDGFAGWRREIPLAVGTNAIRVDIETTAGALLSDATQGSVRRTRVVLSSPVSLDADEDTGVAYVHDELEGLTRFAPATSAWEIVSPETTALSGPYLDGAFDSRTDFYYILSQGALQRVSTVNGTRTDVDGSGPSFGFGSEFLDVDGLGSAYVLGDLGGALGQTVLQVNLVTGDRSEVSSDTRGAGPTLSEPAAFDVAGAGIYVYDADPDTLVAIDPSTGDRTVLLDASADLGFNFADRLDLVVDAAASRAFLADAGVIHLLDWSAGTVTTVFDRADGHEDEVGEFGPIAAVPGNRLLALDARSRGDGRGGQGLVAIELPAGTITRYDESQVGSGVLPRNLELAADSQRGRLYVFDDGNDDVYGLDLGTLARTPISTDVVGSGPEIASGDVVVFDGDATVYVGESSVLYAVDVTTGARSIVSDEAGLGTGPWILVDPGLSWDPGTGSVVAVAADTFGLVRVDPATGDRTMLTMDPFEDPYDLTLDAAGNRIFVAGVEDPGPSYKILEADLATGLVSPIVDFDDDLGDDVEGSEQIAADPADGRLLALDEDYEGAYQVDTGTGALLFLADVTDPAEGPPADFWDHPVALPGTGIFFLSTRFGVLALDAETGERVYVAR